MRFGIFGGKKRKRTKERQTSPSKNRTKERIEAIEGLRILVYKRNGFKCVCRGCSKCQSVFWSKLCGRGQPGLNIDHIMPVSKGGTDDMSNLQALCEECNKEKGNKWKGSGHSYHE